MLICGEGTRSADGMMTDMGGQEMSPGPQSNQFFYKRLEKQSSESLSLDQGGGFLALSRPSVKHRGTRDFIPS